MAMLNVQHNCYLTCIYELSNQAFLTISALLLDIPVLRALYLRATQRNMQQQTFGKTRFWTNPHTLQVLEAQHMLCLHKKSPKSQTSVVSHHLCNTCLIMDVTIGHVFDIHHNFKANTLWTFTNAKCFK